MKPFFIIILLATCAPLTAWAQATITLSPLDKTHIIS
jgi:hypothetical protein